jgi:hypothetical protein
MVADLTRIVGGAYSAQELTVRNDVAPHSFQLPKAAAAVKRGLIERRTKVQAQPRGGRVVKPEEIIPLDDNNFDDFNG